MMWCAPYRVELTGALPPLPYVIHLETYERLGKAPHLSPYLIGESDKVVPHEDRKAHKPHVLVERFVSAER